RKFHGPRNSSSAQFKEKSRRTLPTALAYRPNVCHTAEVSRTGRRPPWPSCHPIGVRYFREEFYQTIPCHRRAQLRCPSVSPMPSTSSTLCLAGENNLQISSAGHVPDDFLQLTALPPKPASWTTAITKQRRSPPPIA